MPLKLEAPRPGRSPYWRIRGTYLGQFIDQSTGSTDRRFASQKLAQVKGQIERGELAPASGPTWASAMTSYLQAGGDPRFLDKLLAYWGETPLANFTQEGIDACAAHLYPNATPATRNRQAYTCISAVMKHAGFKETFRRPKGSRSIPRVHWLNTDQLQRLLPACEAVNPRFGAMCLYMTVTGSRLSEACNLDWRDVDLSAASAIARKTKNGRSRLVHLPPVAVAALANIAPAENPNKGSVFGYTKSGYTYKLLTQAEIASGVIIPDGISFHIFRHSYGALMKRLGADLVGTGAWQSKQAAAVYEHIDATEEARKADFLMVRRVK